MKKILKSQVVTTGLAMFSMFFGAGNIVFPLTLGRIAGDKNIYAILGLLITAVGVPFLGLLGMILFDGDYEKYMYRIGKLPGFLLILLIIALIGPFAAIPRCITLSYDAITPFMGEFVSLLTFSVISAGIIFLFSAQKSKILHILGYVLSPILLVSLVTIIVQGFLYAPVATMSPLRGRTLFLRGLIEGYQTMDLLAAIFFSAVVLNTLKANLHPDDRGDNKKVGLLAVQSSILGASLLGFIYFGMSFIASFYGRHLFAFQGQQFLGAIAAQTLGGAAGFVVSVAVSLACLTTAITLSAVTAEFIRKHLAPGMAYSSALTITLMITVVISTLKFEGIVRTIAPILFLCYPALIVLTVFNILNKLADIKIIKAPVFITFALTILIGHYNDIAQLFGKAMSLLS